MLVNINSWSEKWNKIPNPTQTKIPILKPKIVFSNIWICPISDRRFKANYLVLLLARAHTTNGKMCDLKTSAKLSKRLQQLRESNVKPISGQILHKKKELNFLQKIHTRWECKLVCSFFVYEQFRKCHISKFWRLNKWMLDNLFRELTGAVRNGFSTRDPTVRLFTRLPGNSCHLQEEHNSVPLD